MTNDVTLTDPFVLIHGAWQGSWTFDRLLPELDKAGLVGVAVDLPGNGSDDTDPADVSLDLYLDFLEATIDTLGGRAHVVGHSGAGVIATALGERSPERVSSVIFLAGMCLPQGMDFGELQEHVAGAGEVFGISGDIRVSEDGLTSMVPMVEATNDQSMILQAQRAMQKFIPDMPVVSLNTGHVPQFTDPIGLTRVLNGACRIGWFRSSPDSRSGRSAGRSRDRGNRWKVAAVPRTSGLADHF